MNITKENEELVLRIPLKQKMYNHYMGDDPVGEMDNLVGIVAGRDCSISQLIDMDYKGKPPQEGQPIIMFSDKEELEEECKKLGINIWELPLCAYCNEAIRGVFTIGEKGNQCFKCKPSI